MPEGTPLSYGLTIPLSKKKKVGCSKLKNIFDIKSEEKEKETALTPLPSSEAAHRRTMFDDVQEMRHSTAEEKTQLMRKRALEEDHLVYDYDSAMNAYEAARKAIPKDSTKSIAPKYMTSILERANARKIELEVIKEKQLEKERLAEGQLYQGKDQFITSAYKKKLEERKKTIEKLSEKDKEDANEENSDRFYAHIIEQATGKSN